jgi:hypothetical protein
MIRFAIGLIVLRRDARLLCPTILVGIIDSYYLVLPT